MHMPVDEQRYKQILSELGEANTLVAVSKIKPAEDIRELYDLGQRDFGENYVQELVEKQPQLPSDIRWHFIGHLQTNKVKYIAGFVHLIQGVDSYKLLKEIDKQAARNNRVIDCLLQVHIAQEETKFGFDDAELESLANQLAAAPLEHIIIRGLMGMASFTEDKEKVAAEYLSLKKRYDSLSRLPLVNFKFSILSMGMSSDYPIALREGSNMVRIGSMIFGKRVYPVKTG